LATPGFYAVNTDHSHCSHLRAIIPIVPPFRLLMSANRRSRSWSWMVYLEPARTVGTWSVLRCPIN